MGKKAKGGKMKIFKDKKEIAEIVSQEEAFWREIKESTENDIKRLEKLLKFQKAILAMVEIKINLAK